MLVKNKKPSMAKISIQRKVAQYYFFCVWYANSLYKAICIYAKSLAKGGGKSIARNNIPKKQSSFKLRKGGYIIITSDYPDKSSKRCMRYNVTLGRQLFIKVFNIYFSFARWTNYYGCTWIYGLPYAVSRVKYLCGSTTWSNINILYVISYFYLFAKARKHAIITSWSLPIK